MDAVTYPDTKVIEFVKSRVIPVRIPYDAKPWAKDFNITWTPTTIILDPSGKEHHRTTGFLAPKELMATISLGVGKCYFEQEAFEDAIAALEQVVADYPDSYAAPEALYYCAVSRYKSTHNPASLKEGLEKLQAEYPSSEWTRRAAPYRLI